MAESRRKQSIRERITCIGLKGDPKLVYEVGWLLSPKRWPWRPPIGVDIERLGWIDTKTGIFIPPLDMNLAGEVMRRMKKMGYKPGLQWSSLSQYHAWFSVKDSTTIKAHVRPELAILLAAQAALLEAL